VVRIYCGLRPPPEERVPEDLVGAEELLIVPELRELLPELRYPELREGELPEPELR
jgi:hypothetical protein